MLRNQHPILNAGLIVIHRHYLAVMLHPIQERRVLAQHTGINGLLVIQLPLTRRQRRVNGH